MPVIVVTDLYYPPQDADDNFDLLMAFALPEIDLRAVVLDCTEHFRQPVSNAPGMPVDRGGPRDPGFIPVAQLNYIFDRTVPCAAGPFARLKTPDDPTQDVPKFQQAGVELILKTLRDSAESVDILSFGSARAIAAAFNRSPGLLREKVKRIHLCAGASAPDYLEWNVQLDPCAIVCLLHSGLPIDLYPCATDEGPFAAGVHNTYWQLADLRFVECMHPRLRRYLAFAYSRVGRSDFLRAMDEDSPVDFAAAPFAQAQHMWTQPVWAQVAGRTLVRRVDGYELVPGAEVTSGDHVVMEALRTCSVQISEDGRYRIDLTDKPRQRDALCRVFERLDPQEDVIAWASALPKLYQEFKTGGSKNQGKK